MKAEEQRAHGVTPGLRQDYRQRTAGQQAAFALPYLRPGKKLLDVGCGPGTITVGLARVVAPGQVVGIDHDRQHVAAARALAAEQEVTNVSFARGDALALPFRDGSFDAAFENDMFTHLAQDAGRAAREIYRVLKPGGLLAARDVDASAVVWGHASDALQELDKLFILWHASRGSDIRLGRQLPAIVREAGFTKTIKSVSADTKGTPETVRAHAEITLALLDGPFGRDVVAEGWAEEGTVAWLKESVKAWGAHPDAFFANVHVEVVGWKSAAD
jgi:ubiquinone/menaquinone biosynthesis C-methylase UbiE